RWMRRAAPQCIRRRFPRRRPEGPTFSPRLSMTTRRSKRTLRCGSLRTCISSRVYDDLNKKEDRMPEPPARKKDEAPAHLESEIEVRWFLKNIETEVPGVTSQLKKLNVKITSAGRLVVPYRMGCPFGSPLKCQWSKVGK